MKPQDLPPVNSRERFLELKYEVEEKTIFEWIKEGIADLKLFEEWLNAKESLIIELHNF